MRLLSVLSMIALSLAVLIAPGCQPFSQLGLNPSGLNPLALAIAADTNGSSNAHPTASLALLAPALLSRCPRWATLAQRWCCTTCTALAVVAALPRLLQPPRSCPRLHCCCAGSSGGGCHAAGRHAGAGPVIAATGVEPAPPVSPGWQQRTHAWQQLHRRQQRAMLQCWCCPAPTASDAALPAPAGLCVSNVHSLQTIATASTQGDCQRRLLLARVQQQRLHALGQLCSQRVVLRGADGAPLLALLKHLVDGLAGKERQAAGWVGGPEQTSCGGRRRPVSLRCAPSSPASRPLAAHAPRPNPIQAHAPAPCGPGAWRGRGAAPGPGRAA